MPICEHPDHCSMYIGLRCHIQCAGETGSKEKMRELYTEGLASHGDPESCAGVRKGAGEALTGAGAGWVGSREKKMSRAPTRLASAEGEMMFLTFTTP